MRHDFELMEGCSLLTFKIKNQHLVTKLNVLLQISDLEIDWKKSWIFILKSERSLEGGAWTFEGKYFNYLRTFCVHRVNKKSFNPIWCGRFRRGLFEMRGLLLPPLLKYKDNTIQNWCSFLSYLLKTDSCKTFLICSKFPPCLVTKILLWCFKFL